MKTKDEKKIVDILREIRDKVSSDIKDLSFEELKEYLESRKALRTNVFKKHKAESV